MLTAVLLDFASSFLKEVPPPSPVTGRPIMPMYKKVQLSLACAFNCSSKENTDYLIFLQSTLSAQTDVQSNNPRIIKKHLI